MENRHFKFILMVAFILAISGIAWGNDNTEPPRLPPITSFMTVDGTSFGGGFRFLGANLDPWRFITDSGEIYTQDDIRDWVANAVQYTGAKVIRMHMNGRAFEPSIGNYGEPSFQQLDDLLAAAAEYNVYVIVCTRDYLWTPWPSNADDPYWYLGGGTKDKPNKDAILTNKKAKDAYKNFIAYVLNRENTLTKIKYKDDPHILGWEIINEPNNVQALKAWLREIGGYVKSIDSNHLIAAGTCVENVDYVQGPDELNAFKVPEIDFIDIHYYSDLKNFEDPINQSNLNRYKKWINKALSLGKPVVVGECGCTNNNRLQTILNLYQALISNGFNQGAAGMMPYSWGPSGPNGWGGRGAWCIYYTWGTEICSLLKSLAP